MIEKISLLLTCKESTTYSESTNYSNEESPVHSVSITSDKTEIVSSVATRPHDKSPLPDKLRNCQLIIPLSRLKSLKSLLTRSLKVLYFLMEKQSVKRLILIIAIATQICG